MMEGVGLGHVDVRTRSQHSRRLDHVEAGKAGESRGSCWIVWRRSEAAAEAMIRQAETGSYKKKRDVD
jgi:hypothetical protein